MIKPHPKSILKEMGKIVDYLWLDEKKHWEEENKPRNHIFVSLRGVKRFIAAATKKIK